MCSCRRTVLDRGHFGLDFYPQTPLYLYRNGKMLNGTYDVFQTLPPLTRSDVIDGIVGTTHLFTSRGPS